MKKILLSLICFALLSQALFSETFMDRIREDTKHLNQKILTHPFVRELTEGSLEKNKFDYFKRQDQIYTWRYSDSLGTLATKAPDISMRQFLQKAALSSTREWSGPRPVDREQCPSCFAYSNFEAHSVSQTFSQGLAALTPCYTVYAMVGKFLLKESKQDNPYYNWIQNYVSPHFDEETMQIERYINEAYEKATEVERTNMLWVYTRAVEYEYDFFNSAYEMTKVNQTKEN